MKIISVLTYPYENKLVVVVTRAPAGYFSFPQTRHTYEADYGSERVVSLHKWSEKLQALNVSKLFNTLRTNYLERNKK